MIFILHLITKDSFSFLQTASFAMGTGAHSPGVRGQGDGASPAFRDRRPDAKLRRDNRGGGTGWHQTGLPHSRDTPVPTGTEHPRRNNVKPVRFFFLLC